MGFRENLKAELEYKNMRTADLAEKSGVNKRTIDHYLMNNPQEPSVTNAVKIAQALNVSVEYLVTGNYATGFSETKNLCDFLEKILKLTEKQKSVVFGMVDLLQ